MISSVNSIVKPLDLSVLAEAQSTNLESISNPSFDSLSIMLSNFSAIVQDPESLPLSSTLNSYQDTAVFDMHPLKRAELQRQSSLSAQHATSQLEQLNSARAAKQIPSLQNPCPFENLPDVSEKKKASFNDKAIKSFVQFLKKEGTPIPSPERLEHIAVNACKQILDNQVQRLNLRNRTAGDIALEESPRSRQVLALLQKSKTLLEPFVLRMNHLQNENIRIMQKRKKKSQWCMQLYHDLNNLIHLGNNLESFIHYLDNQIKDQQIAEIIFLTLNNDPQISNQIAAVLRKWASPTTADRLRPLVQSLMYKHIKRENIPFQTHEWCEINPTKALDQISCSKIYDTCLGSDYQAIIINHKVFDPQDLPKIISELYRLEIISAYRQECIDEEIELFLSFSKAPSEKINELLLKSRIPWDEVQKLCGIYTPVWEKIHPLLLEKKHMEEAENQLIKTLPYLRLISNECFESGLSFAEHVFPKIFSQFKIQPVIEQKAAHCMISVESSSCFSVSQIRHLAIFSEKGQLAVFRMKWTVFPNQDPAWRGVMKISDIFINEDLCDHEEKWSILEGFIDYIDPPIVDGHKQLRSPLSSPKTTPLHRFSTSSGFFRKKDGKS